MPFYEYECQSCKFYTEVLQKVSDAPLRKCPSCGKSTLKKLVSAPNFRLKGGGWYETDFKSDQENKRNLAVEKEPEAKASEEPAKKAEDAKATDAKAGESKPVGESKSEVKPAKSAGQSSDGSISSRSSSARRPVSAKKKPAAKAAARRGRVRR
jgi:putative FmdB family regulatory protein